MKELEGMTIRGKKVFVREPEEMDSLSLGQDAQIIYRYLQEEQPEALKQMKKAKTLIPYLTEMQDKISEKILDIVQTESMKHREYGFIKMSQLNTRTLMETRERIFYDLFPISRLDLPLVQNSRGKACYEVDNIIDNDQMAADQELLADIIGGLPYYEAEEMGFLENLMDFQSDEDLLLTEKTSQALDRRLK